MAPVVSALNDAQIAELAHYFGKQSVKADTIKDQRLATIGARIFNYTSPGAPPCAACHGGRGFHGGMMGGGRGMMGGGMGMMMGNNAEAPNLYGQHASYLVAQLDAFAKGTRRGTVMGPIARVWREQDRQAVAEYLSGLR
jgi:cytochrome c553